MDNSAITTTLKRTPFTGLPASAFQHPLDRQATENLKKIKGFDWLVKKYIEYGIERMEYVNNVGGAIRIGPRQMPKLYAMLLECCSILDVPEPELYAMYGGVNAYTSGHNNPFIVLQTGLLDVMDDNEVMGVIAHELGHIKCGHVLYKMMARGIKPLLEMVSSVTMGIGGLVGAGIEIALFMWDRRTELSSDRAALLVLQDVRPCVTMLMKLAGGTKRYSEGQSGEQFLNQARAYKEGLDQSALDRFYRFMANTNNTHPFPVERARFIDEWANSAEYNNILAGNYPQANQMMKTISCPTCNQGAEQGAKFCLHCGTPLVTR
jgi:Zn-dependent protease with chaperone function